MHSIQNLLRTLVPLLQLAFLLWLLLLESVSDLPWISLFGLLLWLRALGFMGKLFGLLLVSLLVSALYTASLAVVLPLFLLLGLLVEELGYRLSQSLRLHLLAVLVGGGALGVLVGFHWTMLSLGILICKLTAVSIGTLWWRHRHTAWVKRARFRLGL